MARIDSRQRMYLGLLTFVNVSTENILYSTTWSSFEKAQRRTNDFSKKHVVQRGRGLYRGKHND